MEEQPSLSYRLLPDLAETGSYREAEGVLALDFLYRGLQRFDLVGGVSYKVDFTNSGGAVILRGLAHATGSSECARCLEEATFDVEGAVEGYFILNPTEQEIENSDDEFTAVGRDGIIDLKAPVVAAIIFELPQILLCKMDCAGLCQKCGANLNLETCVCGRAPDEDHPFSALKVLIDNN